MMKKILNYYIIFKEVYMEDSFKDEINYIKDERIKRSLITMIN